jgi:hypothetical protein
MDYVSLWQRADFFVFCAVLIFSLPSCERLRLRVSSFIFFPAGTPA